jgi:hypothetical protein
VQFSKSCVIVCAVIAAALQVGCASDTQTVNGVDDSLPTDAGAADTAQTTTTPPAQPKDASTCKPHCATNSDCQTSCGAAPEAGVYCCDVPTGVCHAFQGSACQTPASDSGVGPAY